MVDKIGIGGGQPVERPDSKRAPVVSKKDAGESFDAVIRNEIGKWKGVKFSAHALQRLNERNIQLNSDDRSKILEAIDRAQSKGAKDSLVLVRGTALVISVKNRTIVTVLDRDEMNGNVFTNIDSAVIMNGE